MAPPDDRRVPRNMPALTIPSPTDTSPKSPTDTTPDKQEERAGEPSPSRSRSPERPPVSPITPTVSAAQLAPVEPIKPQQPQLPQPTQQNNVRSPPTATFMRQPAPVPISESDNPDVIALRSAISLLQLQREKSKRDLKTLEELKHAAVADPEAFGRAIQAQRKQSLNSHVDPLSPTLSDAFGSDMSASDGTAQSWDERKDSAGAYTPASDDSTPKFPAIPQPQNVVRCPPVNWTKYHIVGEPLDRMHEEQRRWPGSMEPPRTLHGQRAPPHAVASPYSPFTDVIRDSQATRPHRATKKSLS